MDSFIKNCTVRELLSQLSREAYDYGYTSDRLMELGDTADFSDRYDFHKASLSIKYLCSEIIKLLS